MKDRDVPSLARGPGVAKATGAGLVSIKRVALARGTDAGWRALFDGADSVSEGSVRDEAAGRVWYGSTSLILAVPAKTPPALRDFIVAFAARDLHVRLRAIRAACREATLRAPAQLGGAVCEIRIFGDSQGVRIDVDVQAPLIGGSGKRVSARRT